jgi:hypothetical protein
LLQATKSEPSGDPEYMVSTQALIDSAIESLEQRKQNIYEQIKGFVQESQKFEKVSHFVFQINSRDWYDTYFYACTRSNDLCELSLEWPRFLEEAVNKSREPDGDETALNEAVDDLLIEIIAEDWKKAGGTNLPQPAYIFFLDSSYYYDIKQGDYVDDMEPMK